MKRAPKNSKAPAARHAPGNWPLVLIDGRAVRDKARKRYERARRDLQAARADLDRFENVDRPAYLRWLHGTFGAILTEIRELQAKALELELLIDEIREEALFGGCRTAGEAYRRVMNEREQSAEDPAGETDSGRAGKGHRSDHSGNTDDEPDFDFEDFFRRLCDDEIPERKGREVEKPAVAQRLKDLYRELVRRLHPDKGLEMTPHRLELWHQTQDAYERRDAQQLEHILNLLEVEEGGARDASVSVLSRLADSCRKSLRELRRVLVQYQRDAAWNFSALKDRSAISREMSSLLEEQRAGARGAIRQYESLLAEWKRDSEVSRTKRGRRRVKAGIADEEFF